MSGSPSFSILRESTVYKRWIKVLDRRVRFPNGKEVAWDVAATSNFVVVLPFHTSDSTITMIREYGQGPNELVYALAGGCYEPHKTPTKLACAQAELSEEARLHAGTWESLLPDEHEGIVELKWCANRFWPFLVVDAEVDPTPGKRDEEEECITVERLPTKKVYEMIVRGEVMLASVQAIIMGTERLKSRGIRVDGW